MAAKASLEQFDVILTAGPKGLDIEDEKLLNTLRSPKRTLEPESVGFPLCLITTFQCLGRQKGKSASLCFGLFFSSACSLYCLTPFGWLSRTRKYKPFASTQWTFPWPMAKELKMRNYADRVLVSYARRLRRLDRIYFEMLTGDLDETNIARKQWATRRGWEVEMIWNDIHRISSAPGKNKPIEPLDLQNYCISWD